MDKTKIILKLEKDYIDLRKVCKNTGRKGDYSDTQTELLIVIAELLNSIAIWHGEEDE